MSLIDRLSGFPPSPLPEGFRKLAVLAFWAMLREMALGKVTQQQIITYFGLDADEQTELTWLIGRYNAQPTESAKNAFVELMLVIFIAAESRIPGYTTNAQIVARINNI